MVCLITEKAFIVIDNIRDMKYKPENDRLSEIKLLIARFHEIVVISESQQERKELISRLRFLCQVELNRISIDYPELLVALMDAYEVTRDEGMLQEVLDVVSGNMDRLEVSAVGVKLLAYCYYYVEEEECVAKAREMLEKLRRRVGNEEELIKVEGIVKELIK